MALLFAQRAVLLHAPSGAGKSSLVSAGLIPRARRRGFEFLPVARVRGTGPGSDGPEGNRYVANVIDNWRAAGLVVPSGATTLHGVLSSLPAVDEPGRVVVFDQIEELFVLHPDRWQDRGDFFSQVQEALDHDQSIHFLFVLRDDYLAWLESLTPRLRDRLSTRYHLAGLSSAQALEAIVKPLATTGRAFAPGIAEKFVAALRAQPADHLVNQSYEGEDVEPVQLQIVCRTFYERLPVDVTEISAEHVAHYADVQQALLGFYEQAVAAAVKIRAGVRERRVRLWFERQLITPARTRGIVFQGERTTGGLPNQVVDELERRRIIRSEPRGPALWYELTHDRLIDAVLGSNRVWYAKRSRTVTRRAAAAVAAFALLAGVVLVVAFHGRKTASTASGIPGPAKGQISTPGQTVDFHVRGRTGQLLTAVMVPSDGLDGELQLLNAQGSAIGDPSPAESSAALVSQPLPADGDYRIEARGRGSTTGSFELTFGVQNVGARGELVAPDPIPGSITAPDQVDLYSFDGRAGALAKITVEGGLSNRGLLLVGPGGQGFYVASGTDDVIAAVLPTDGRYRLQVFSLSNGTGPYRVQLQLPEGIDAQPGTVTGTVTEQAPIDVRRVQSQAGGALAVSYDHLQQPIDDVSLLAADGRTLVADYGTGHINWLIAPGGTYLLVVSGKDFKGRSSYSVSMTLQEPLPIAGGSAQGQLGGVGQNAVYRQDSQQGDVATILVTPSKQLDAVVTVVQPDGTTLKVQDSQGAGLEELFTLSIQQTGPHLIVINAYSAAHATGGFRLAVRESKAASPSP